MSAIRIHERLETFRHEQLKQTAETALNLAARTDIGSYAIGAIGGNLEPTDRRLDTVVVGIPFATPVGVAAGWTKDAKAVDGLHGLGFSFVEVGSILAFGQTGNPRPRLRYRDGAGLNSMGFNTPGADEVEKNLEKQRRLGIVGINIGLNKVMPHDYAPWAHAYVARKLGGFADYAVINVASPNTPGLKKLFKTRPLTDIIQAVQEGLVDSGRVAPSPLFVKTTVDLEENDMARIIGICETNGLAGIIDSNTITDPELKKRYGWSDKPGGLSGAIPEYRSRADKRMKFLALESSGTGLSLIGVGAINSAQAAVDRMGYGANLVQVLTGIRQRGPRIATGLNRGISDYMSQLGMGSIEELVGHKL
jgi:dihydroorotate dehydrogenase